MTLTDDQKLEMTETIARAAWPSCYQIDYDEGVVWENDHGGLVHFRPFANWNDAMRALNTLLPLADFSVSYVRFHGDDPWVQVTISIWSHPDCGGDPEYEGNGANELEALAAALHEIAKAKLDGE